MAQKAKIGLLLSETENIRWKNDSLLFCLKIHWLGDEVMTEVANNDAGIQFQQAKKLIKDGAQVLVVIPVDGRQAKKIVDYAHKHQVQVIAYDRFILDCELDHYISFDNVKVGELQAKYALQKADHGKYMLIGGPMSDHNSSLLEEGWMHILDNPLKNKDIKLVYNKHLKSWSENEAYLEVLKFFGSHKTSELPNVIIASNDALARGARRALDELNYNKEVIITGQDGEEQAFSNIIDHKQTMTVYKPISIIAEEAAILADKLAKHSNIRTYKEKCEKYKDIPYYKIEPIVVDDQNVRDFFKGQ